MRVDINNLMKATTYARHKGITKTHAYLLVSNDKLTSIKIEDYIFIVIDNRSLRYHPIWKKKSSEIPINKREPYYANTDNIMSIQNFAKAKDVTVHAVYYWIRKKKITTKYIDCTNFIILNRRAKYIKKDDSMVRRHIKGYKVSKT